jgi:hypothetical protein
MTWHKYKYTYFPFNVNKKIHIAKKIHSSLLNGWSICLWLNRHERKAAFFVPEEIPVLLVDFQGFFIAAGNQR